MQITNKYLTKISRVRIEETRNLVSGIRLDRNERVSNWKPFIKKKLLSVPDYFFSTYPDLNPLYKNVSKFDKIPVNQILITSGIDGGIKTVFETLLKAGDLIGVVSPTYAMYQVYSDIFRTQIFKIDYRIDRKFNFEKFKKFLKKKPKIFFLPNPNQPIEDNISINQLDFMAQKLNKINCLFFIDEAYFLFGQKTALPLLKKYKNIIIARTFSKGFGLPSIRLGYLVSNHHLISILSKKRFAHETNSLSAYFANYFLKNFQICKKYINEIKKSREDLKKKLRKININSYGDKGNYLLIEMNSKEHAFDMVSNLRKKLIYAKGPWKKPFEKFFSITIGPSKIMNKFYKIFSQLLFKKN
jgi:histidinol-phosphate aminotransferase